MDAEQDDDDNTTATPLVEVTPQDQMNFQAKRLELEEFINSQVQNYAKNHTPIISIQVQNAISKSLKVQFYAEMNAHKDKYKGSEKGEIFQQSLKDSIIEEVKFLAKKIELEELVEQQIKDYLLEKKLIFPPQVIPQMINMIKEEFFGENSYFRDIYIEEDAKELPEIMKMFVEQKVKIIFKDKDQRYSDIIRSLEKNCDFLKKNTEEDSRPYSTAEELSTIMKEAKNPYFNVAQKFKAITDFKEKFEAYAQNFNDEKLEPILVKIKEALKDFAYHLTEGKTSKDSHHEKINKENESNDGTMSLSSRP